MLRAGVIRHFRCHITVCYTQVITPTSADAFPGLTADARVPRTGARPSKAVAKTALTCGGSYFHSSTAFGPCPEREKIILVTMAALC